MTSIIQRAEKSIAPGQFGKALIVCHRSLGAATCVLFMLWFTSGVVMMYWGFPSVTAQVRLDRSAALEASRIRLSPSAAYAKLGVRQLHGQIRLNTFDRRPVYRFRAGRGGDRLIYADTGKEQTEVSSRETLFACGHPGACPVSGSEACRSQNERDLTSIRRPPGWWEPITPHDGSPDGFIRACTPSIFLGSTNTVLYGTLS